MYTVNHRAGEEGEEEEWELSEHLHRGELGHGTRHLFLREHDNFSNGLSK